MSHFNYKSVLESIEGAVLGIIWGFNRGRSCQNKHPMNGEGCASDKVPNCDACIRELPHGRGCPEKTNAEILGSEALYSRPSHLVTIWPSIEHPCYNGWLCGIFLRLRPRTAQYCTAQYCRCSTNCIQSMHAHARSVSKRRS